MQQFIQLINAVPPMAWGGVLAAIVLLLLVVRLLRPKREEAGRRQGLPQVDLNQLGTHGPPEGPWQLVCRHVPVRLALVVLAPAGRSGLPAAPELAMLVDQIVPGLGGLLQAHAPKFHVLPPQLSHEGFVRTFFRQIHLPGRDGKGTLWCAAAGRCEIQGMKLNLGLVMRSAGASNLGQEVIADEYGWRDVLAIKQP